MNKLWGIFFAALIVSFLIEQNDRRHIALHRRSKDIFFTVVLVLLLGLFCGLRTWYNDTVTYLGIYEQAPKLSSFLAEGKMNFAQGIGFSFVNSALKTLGFSSQDFLMFYSFLTIIPYVKFIRRYSDSTVMATFLMFTTGMYTFTFAAVKQCVALAFCLLAVIAAIDRKWFSFSVHIVIAVLFHPYAIVYLIVPLMFFKPWSFYTYVCIILFVTIGFLLNSLTDNLLDITTLIGANYTEDTFVGEGVNIFRVLVAFVPMFLSLLCSNLFFINSPREMNLFFNLTMVHALIMFVGLFGTANYFARLANYFLPAPVVLLPWMINKLSLNSRRLIKSSCVVGYTCYFIYGNFIQHVFDNCFSQMKLLDYLASHF